MNERICFLKEFMELFKLCKVNLFLLGIADGRNRNCLRKIVKHSLNVHVFRSSFAEILLLIGPLFLILIVELLNSSIEALAATVPLEHTPMIGRAKDLGSAAVFLTIVLTVLIWACVFMSQFFAE